MIDGEVNRQAMMVAFLNSFMMIAVMMALLAPLPFHAQAGQAARGRSHAAPARLIEPSLLAFAKATCPPFGFL